MEYSRLPGPWSNHVSVEFPTHQGQYLKHVEKTKVTVGELRSW